jgi:hypothetical protein
METIYLGFVIISLVSQIHLIYIIIQGIKVSQALLQFYTLFILNSFILAYWIIQLTK